MKLLGAGLLGLLAIAGCTRRRAHHDEPPLAATPGTMVPDAGVVTAVALPGKRAWVVGAGREASYLAAVDLEAGTKALLRRRPGAPDEVLATSFHGFVMDTAAVYWTDPGLGGAGQGGLWRATRTDGKPEQLVSGLNLPEKVAVSGNQLVYWEGGRLMTVNQQGGAPGLLLDLEGVAFEVVGDDRAVYWTGGEATMIDGKAMRRTRLLRVALAEPRASSMLAEVTGEAGALVQYRDRIYFGHDTPAGLEVVAVPKAGGAPVVLATGQFDAQSIAVLDERAYLIGIDAAGHGTTVQRTGAPGSAPEIVFVAPAGARLRGLASADGRIWVGQLGAEAP